MPERFRSPDERYPAAPARETFLSTEHASKLSESDREVLTRSMEVKWRVLAFLDQIDREAERLRGTGLEETATSLRHLSNQISDQIDILDGAMSDRYSEDPLLELSLKVRTALGINLGGRGGIVDT